MVAWIACALLAATPAADPIEGVWGVDVSPGGRTVATVHKGYATHIWDLDSGSLLQTLAEKVEGEEDYPECDLLTSVEFSPDGRKVACGSSNPDGLFSPVWTLADGRLQKVGLPIQVDASEGFHEVAWSARADLLYGLVGRMSGRPSLVLTDLKTGQLKYVAPFPDADRFAVHPQSDLVAFFAGEFGYQVWKPFSGLSERFEKGPPLQEDQHAELLRFSPDGKLLAIAVSQDNRYSIWFLDPAGTHWSFPFASMKIRAIEFAPNGKSLYAGGLNGELCQLDVGQGTKLHVWKTPTRRHVRSLSASADGRRLIVGSSETEAVPGGDVCVYSTAGLVLERMIGALPEPPLR